MKGKNKLMALLLGIIMIFSFCMMSACGDKPDTPPEPSVTDPAEVESVAIRYNNANVDSMLSMNLSVGTFELQAAVVADAKAEYTVTWSSSEKEVATIAGQKEKATVTLAGAGETIIKVEAGKKSASFILTVEDDTPKTSYTITVSGGIAKDASGQSVTSAIAGTQITLQATPAEHKTFSSWTLDPNLTLTGSTFTMPEANVTATAVFTDTLYELTLVGATVKSVKEGEIPAASDGGYSSALENSETKITTYGVKFGTEVTIQANAASAADRIFVGFDYLIENNRVGDMGVDEYTFTMGDLETTSYTAIYSAYQNSVWTAGAPDALYNAAHGAKKITDGNGDPDLEGMSGYRFAFQDSATKIDGAPENIRGSSFLCDGRGMGKIILKNNGTRTVKLEFYATFCGLLATSGVIEVAPGKVVTRYFTINIGIKNSWWGVALREDVGGSGDEWITVDAVLGVANTAFPHGDPYLTAGPDAQVVSPDPASQFEGPNWGAESRPVLSADAERGYISLASWGHAFGPGDSAEGRWGRYTITNMPAYDASTGKTVIYGRAIYLGQSMVTTPKGSFKFVVGKDADDPTTGVSAVAHFENMGDTVLFKLEIPRTAADDTFYIFIVKEQVEPEAITYNYGFGFILHLTYNNVFNYEEV